MKTTLLPAGLVLAAGAALAFGVPASGQAPRPLSIVALAEIPRVVDAQLSPDGRFVSYMLQRADWKADRQVPHIWKQAVAGGTPIQITSDASGEANARWSPDSRMLLFVKAAENGAQIFLLSAEGGEPRQLSRHVTGIAAPAWAPDGTAIYFLASDPQTPDERERQRLRADIYAYDDIKQRHLWKVSVATGAEQKLTDGNFSIIAFRVSRDGTRIVQLRAPTRLEGDDYLREVWLTGATGDGARRLTSNTIEELEPEISPDNSTVLFVAESNDRFESIYNSALFTVSAAGGTPQLVLRDFQYAIDHASWTADGKAIVASVNMGAHSELFRIDPAAHAAKPLTDGAHSVQFWSEVASVDQMVFQFDEPIRLGDVWTLSAAGGSPRRVTGVYDSLGRDYALPRQEKLSWKGADGVTVEGLLFYPIGYQPGTRYPLVVQLHGGPAESDKFGYGPGVIVNYVPVLSAKGYAVLRPNYRGSTGYGNAFMRDVVGHYFNNMHLDVLAGVDALVAKGVADPQRLAVMGWSAGAHLTNKIITVTDRFKAASSSAGAANWTSMLAETDSRQARVAWFGGTPWQKDAPIAAFWNSSPIKDASNVRTPTLLIAGQDDARVPLPQAIEMFRALKANGVDTKLYVAPREQHQWSGLRHQLFKANAELEWFEHYVMGRAYTWERAPGDPADAGFAALKH